ncbi:hypothetical protein RSOLAG22IIIB_01100 [Rhizoctonia solani]|uniref:N-alpha-acetyltransferase 40 n=1 Tax=Rhizoctonia solani TaxID=456999 RepID=A0A0K6G1Q8_9AGAM|nr:hypothetical protein RSOLAG22IIIB_01100 [Rhizoctonia solani]
MASFTMGKESYAKRKKIARNVALAKPLVAAPRKPALPEILAKKANGVLLDKFLPASAKTKSKGQPKKWTRPVYDGPALGADAALKSQVWNIFAAKMEEIYKKAKDPHIKWNPRERKEELYNEHSRLIVVQNAQGSVQAFSMFRFEAESNYYGKMEFLMYIYEIQVTKGLWGTGVCRRAFTALESIAREFQAQLIMLTCFKCDTRALSIYEYFE